MRFMDANWKCIRSFMFLFNTRRCLITIEAHSTFVAWLPVPLNTHADRICTMITMCKSATIKHMYVATDKERESERGERVSSACVCFVKKNILFQFNDLKMCNTGQCNTCQYFYASHFMHVCARWRWGARCAMLDNDDNRIIFPSKCVCVLCVVCAIQDSFNVHSIFVSSYLAKASINLKISFSRRLSQTTNRSLDMYMQHKKSQHTKLWDAASHFC